MGKKKGGLKINEKIMLVPETIEMFALLQLEPPSTTTGVRDAVQKLKEKKAWFKTLERNAVPSIRDKQKADEVKQQSKRDRSERTEGTAAKSHVQAREARDASKGGGFNAADLSAVDDAFPSLPGRISSIKNRATT